MGNLTTRRNPPYDAVHITNVQWGNIESLANTTHSNVLSRLKFPLIDGAVRLLDLFVKYQTLSN